jgi:hypothetical protein
LRTLNLLWGGKNWQIFLFSKSVSNNSRRARNFYFEKNLGL